MKISFIETHSYNPWENLAVEAALMETIAHDEVIFYLWQNQNTVVIGKNQNPWKECRMEELEADGGFLARRASGGGAVFHDLGNLNFSFISCKEYYNLEQQLSVILKACHSFGIDAQFSGRNDIQINGMKFSGNAFQHSKSASLQHGTLLIDVDMDKLGKYLKPSKEKMQSKGINSVKSRVCNLNEFLPNLSVEAMRERLKDSFEEIYAPANIIKLKDIDEKCIKKYYDRFSSWDWRIGETMNFDVEMETRFSWGNIELKMQLHRAKIAAIKVYSDSMDADISERIETALLGASYGRDMAKAICGIVENKFKCERIGTEDSERINQYNDIGKWLAEKQY